MSSERNVEVRLNADVSKFVEAMRRVRDVEVRLNADVSKFVEAMRRVRDGFNEWARIRQSRDTRQVPCTVDHDKWFRPSGEPDDYYEWLPRRGLIPPCPGCGAAL